MLAGVALYGGIDGFCSVPWCRPLLRPKRRTSRWFKVDLDSPGGTAYRVWELPLRVWYRRQTLFRDMRSKVESRQGKRQLRGGWSPQGTDITGVERDWVTDMQRSLQPPSKTGGFRWTSSPIVEDGRLDIRWSSARVSRASEKGPTLRVQHRLAGRASRDIRRSLPLREAMVEFIVSAHVCEQTTIPAHEAVDVQRGGAARARINQTRSGQRLRGHRRGDVAEATLRIYAIMIPHS